LILLYYHYVLLALSLFACIANSYNRFDTGMQCGGRCYILLVYCIEVSHNRFGVTVSYVTCSCCCCNFFSCCCKNNYNKTL